MRRAVVVIPIGLLVLAALLSPARSTGFAANVGSGSLAKKVCKTVAKKVHGKKKKVKVCHTVKSKPTATPTPTPIPPSDLARELADEVAHAGSLDARKTALLHVMTALRIGVYDSKTGNAISPGAERSARDFFLYDVELISLAGGMERKEMRSVDDLASLLTALGVKPDGAAVNSDALRRIVIAVTRGAMSHAGEQAALLPLLVRELGLRHEGPYDLAQDVPADKLQLDALQFMLLSADILAPIVRAAAATPTAQRHLSARDDIHPCKAINVVTGLTSPNTWLDFFGVHVNFVTDAALAGPIGELIKAITAKELPDTDLVSTILTGLHGILLSYSIKIESLPPVRQVTHYGPPGHFSADDGKPMSFKAQVTMQDDLGEGVLLCLNAAGFTVPKKGPIPNVGITWHPTDGDLEKHGTITFNPPGSDSVFRIADQQTGPDGIAAMNFTPKNENVPGFGQVVTKTGGLEPRALWGMAFENPLASINQLITPKLGEELFWTVTYHKPRGFKFEHLKWHVHFNNGTGFPESTSDFDVSGQVCGDDPSKQWDLTITEKDDWPVQAHYHYEGTFSDVWSPGHLIPVRSSPAEMQMSPALILQTQPRIDLTVTTHTANPQVAPAGPASQTVSAPITEDTSCPDNSDEG